MSELTPTKSYMVRAIHEWCLDNALTPHLAVIVNANTIVPKAYVKDGEIVLNLSYTATKDLHLDNEAVTFSARFAGAPQNLYVPMDAVRGIFARENGQGMFFELAEQKEMPGLEAGKDQPKNADDRPREPEELKKKRPNLTIVK